jgi:hypothetical protein
MVKSFAKYFKGPNSDIRNEGISFSPDTGCEWRGAWFEKLETAKTTGV